MVEVAVTGKLQYRKCNLLGAVTLVALLLGCGDAASPLRPVDFVVAGLTDDVDSAMVRHMLGEPNSIHTEENPLAPGTRFVAWIYPSLTVSFTAGGRRLAVALRGPGWATARGLRVGHDAGRVRTLYGRPKSRYRSQWFYQAREAPTHLLAITVVGGKVRRIFLGRLVE